jgi:hypothetical protein
MTAEEVLVLLARLEGRLTHLEEQARETREKAQSTLDLLARLREDLGRARRALLARPTSPAPGTAESGSPDEG